MMTAVALALMLVLGNSSLEMWSNSHSAKEKHVPQREFEASLQPS